MSQRAESLARFIKVSTPTILGLFGVILLSLPVRFGEGLLPTPMLPLVVVFFWSIYAPRYLPALSVFIIGLLQDFLSGAPLGLWALIYLSTQYVVMYQRAYFSGRELQVVWVGFAVAMGFAGLLLWLIMSLMNGAALPVGGLIAQMAATIAVYPFFAAAFSHLQSRVIVEE